VSDRLCDSSWQDALRRAIRSITPRAPTFVARPLDAIVERRDLDGHSITDVTYVVARYLVAASACVYGFARAAIEKLVGRKDRKWTHVLDQFDPLLAKVEAFDEETGTFTFEEKKEAWFEMAEEY